MQTNQEHTPFKFLDAFSGIGGFHLGIKSACEKKKISCECVAAIENDRHSSKVYIDNFGVTPLGDITKIEIKELPEHDLLVGGFPCQPFSISGKNHLDVSSDNRHLLYRNLVDILNEKKPRFFIFENVANLKNVKLEGIPIIDMINQDLVNCGYKVHVKELNSANFGVPQQRKRLFWVGLRNDIEKPFKFPEGVPITYKIADIMDQEVPPKFYMENLWRNRKLQAKTPIELHTKFKRHPHPKNTDRYTVLRWLVENSTKKIVPGKINLVASITGDTPSGISRQQDRLYSIEGIHPTVATFGIPCVNATPFWRCLTPREYHRLQGFPDGFRIDSKDSNAYKQAGNAVTVPVIEHIVGELL